MSSSYLLQSCKSFQIIVTNSLPQKHNTDFFGAKMEVVDISGMVSEYIRRSHYNESVSVLSSNYTPGLKEVFRQQHRQQVAASEVGIFSNIWTIKIYFGCIAWTKFFVLDNRGGAGGPRNWWGWRHEFEKSKERI